MLEDVIYKHANVKYNDLAQDQDQERGATRCPQNTLYSQKGLYWLGLYKQNVHFAIIASQGLRTFPFLYRQETKQIVIFTKRRYFACSKERTRIAIKTSKKLRNGSTSPSKSACDVRSFFSKEISLIHVPYMCNSCNLQLSSR